MELRGQQIGVIGLGPRTGMSLVRYLSAQGARVVVYDEAGSKAVRDRLGNFSESDVVVEENPGAALDSCPVWIVSPGVPCYKPYLIAARKRGIRTVSEIEFAAERINAPILAVTGTNGKSTTTAWLGHVLAQFKPSVFVGGNLGVPLLEAVGKAWDFVVVEISSFQMELTDRFFPVAACVLNVSPNHLDRHGNMATYAFFKEKVVAGVRSGGRAVLCADDEPCRDMRARVRAHAWTFSVRKGARADFSIEGDRMRTPMGILSIRDVKLLGRHNLENALAVAALALSVGCPIETVERGLSTFEGLPHRLQNLGEVRGVLFVNDSKSTTPASSIRALEAIDRPLFLLAGGKPKGFSYASLGQAAKARAKRAILFGEAAPAMAKEFEHSKVVDTLDQAFEAATAEARVGDAVLLSPANASYDQFANFEARGDRFVALVDRWRDAA